MSCITTLSIFFVWSDKAFLFAPFQKDKEILLRKSWKYNIFKKFNILTNSIPIPQIRIIFIFLGPPYPHLEPCWACHWGALLSLFIGHITFCELGQGYSLGWDYSISLTVRQESWAGFNPGSNHLSLLEFET